MKKPLRNENYKALFVGASQQGYSFASVARFSNSVRVFIERRKQLDALAGRV